MTAESDRERGLQVQSEDRACYRCGRDVESDSDAARCHGCTDALRGLQVEARLAAATPGQTDTLHVCQLWSTARHGPDHDLMAHAPDDLRWALDVLARAERAEAALARAAESTDVNSILEAINPPPEIPALEQDPYARSADS